MADIILPQPGDEITSDWGTSVAQGINGIQSGTVSVTGATSTVNGTATVAFPKPYRTAPIVVAICGSTVVNTAVAAITTSSFQAQTRRMDGSSSATTQTVQWIAIGELA